MKISAHKYTDTFEEVQFGLWWEGERFSNGSWYGNLVLCLKKHYFVLGFSNWKSTGKDK